LGLGTRETKDFSFIRAITAVVNKDWTMAPFELECSRAVAKNLGQKTDPNRFFVPYEVLERPVQHKRDVSVAASGGGYLVQTDNVGFIEMVRNRSVCFQAGVRRLSGLTGLVMIPKQTAAATGYWLTSETNPITESQQTFVQVPLTPKTVGAYTEISRQLLLQSSPGVEGLVTADLAAVVSIAADAGILNGAGTAQPTGIVATGSIGGVTGTSLAYAGIVEFQTDVAGNNIIPAAGAYITTPAVAGLLMTRMKVTNDYSPLWEGSLWTGTMVGYPAFATAQMTAASMLFGDFSECVVGEWGVLEVDVNPYASFAAGIIGVRAIYSMDVAVRRAGAFSLATTIT
jgi:HK97 family phage major capsid protein